MLHLFLVHTVEVLLLLFDHFELHVEVLLHGLQLAMLTLQLLLALVQVHLALLQLRLDRLNLRVALSHLLLQVRLQVDELLLHLEQLVFLNHFGLFLGLLQYGFVLRLQHVAHNQPRGQCANKQSYNRYNYQRS